MSNGANGLNGTSGDTRLPLIIAQRFPSAEHCQTWICELSKRFRFTERYNLELLARRFSTSLTELTFSMSDTDLLYQLRPTIRRNTAL
ncbi:MAG: hypothetical protein WKF71_11765 [Pyrinomonadaceae bacterium]